MHPTVNTNSSEFCLFSNPNSIISLLPDLQEGFAPPEEDDLDEQAHLGQDEYWSPRFPPPWKLHLPFPFYFWPNLFSTLHAL